MNNPKSGRKAAFLFCSIQHEKRTQNMKQVCIPDFSNPLAQPFLMENGEHAVLLIHGFTGSIAHMRMLADGLYERGFTVQGINLPGHAKNLEAMRETGWKDWLSAARTALVGLKKKYRHASVVGLSMGGVISLILAEEGIPTADIPVSAPIAVQNKLMPFAKVLAPLSPVTDWGEPGPAEALKDPAYDLGYGGFPTKCAADLAKLIKMARNGLGSINCPVLCVQSHADDTIDPGSADVILGGIASKEKKMLWLDDVPHVCTITKEAPRIVDTAAAFLRAAE